MAECRKKYSNSPIAKKFHNFSTALNCSLLKYSVDYILSYDVMDPN